MHGLNEYAGILLAAGRGKRFDPTGTRDKLMQQLDSGEPVAARVATAMCAALPGVVAVVRSDAEVVGTSLSDRGCEVIVCPEAGEGMGASLAFAVSHARNAAGWIIGLADMPFVQASTFRAVLEALAAGADIAVPVYQGRRGNPVGFSRRYLSELLSMGGDQGARRLLNSFPVTEVAVDDPGIHLDIDTVNDLTEGRRVDKSVS